LDPKGTCPNNRGDHFRFGSIRFLLKKSNQSEILKKKPKPVQTDWFRLGFLGQKSVQTSLAWFGLVLTRFFSGLARFGFFSFRLIKPKPN
jgi:hypothetical protein